MDDLHHGEIVRRVRGDGVGESAVDRPHGKVRRGSAQRRTQVVAAGRREGRRLGARRRGRPLHALQHGALLDHTAKSECKASKPLQISLLFPTFISKNLAPLSQVRKRSLRLMLVEKDAHLQQLHQSCAGLQLLLRRSKW